MIKIILFSFLIHNAATAAYTDEVISDVAVQAAEAEINSNNNVPDTRPVSAMPRLSIDTDSPLDMNWGGLLTLNGEGATPQQEQIVLPFWRDHPINNLSIKLRVLDVWF